MIGRIFFLCLLLLSAGGAYADPFKGDPFKGDPFKGVYFAFKIGWQGSLQQHEGEVALVNDGGDGFGFNGAAGVRLDFGLPLWFSTDLELGFQRYSIPVLGGANDSSQILSFIGSGYAHFLDRHSAHNVFLGAGIGGGFASAKLTQPVPPRATLAGTSFLAQGTLGYDYIILERSRFSSEYLRAGVLGRFLYAEGFRQEQLAQVMLVVTYGF